MTVEGRNSRLLLVSAAAFALLIVAVARAATGDLTPVNCFQQAGGTACGANQAEGLEGARAVAVSSDGKSVYVASGSESDMGTPESGSEAIVAFDRIADGSLFNPRCVEQTTMSPDCAGQAEGLEGAAAVAVSPDGDSVYVASAGDDGISGSEAVAIFDRAANGDLVNPRCIEDDGKSSCGMNNQTAGLDGARGVAVSPDGSSVYVVAGSTSGSTGSDTVISFDRAADGSLSDPVCIEDVTMFADCVGAEQAPGLEGASGVAISPDGTSVYVASRIDGAIVSFDRAVDGSLSDPVCIEDVTMSPDCAGAEQAPGLEQARAVAVSPDGKSVYVAASADSSIVTFDRAANGDLSNPRCIESEFESECGAGNQVSGLEVARSVAVSPDGASVYVAAEKTDSLISVDRAPNGDLANPRCIEETTMFDECDGNEVDGLEGPAGVAVSRDGASVYVATRETDTVYGLAREDSSPPETAITGGPAEGAITTDSTPTFAFNATEPGFGLDVLGATFTCQLSQGAAAAAFAPCSDPAGGHTPANPLDPGSYSFEVVAADLAGNQDPTPARRTFTVERFDTEVALRIKGKKLKLNRKRRLKVRITCRADEASPPCETKLKLKTRKKLRLGKKGAKGSAAAKRKRITLAKLKRFKPVAAGQTRKLKLRLSKQKARLVRRKKKARKVRVIARARDQAGNRAKIAKKSKIVLAKRKGKR